MDESRIEVAGVGAVKLAEMAARLDALGRESFMSGIKRRVGDGCLELLAVEFASSLGPTGAAWAPLKYRNGLPLVKTGAMRDSFTAYPMQNGVRIQAGVDYAAYHQTGTRNMPARPMLPSGSLPPAWLAVVETAYNDAVRRAVTGG